MKILVLGGGGREHALVHALSQSTSKPELHAAPGNPGIASLATLHAVEVCSPEKVLALCRSLAVDLLVIGPEAPLIAGVADHARAHGIAVFGPGADGARLEGSKAFAKSFMARYGIATARFAVCTTLDHCETALKARGAPYVIKADGLAAGKGVFLPRSLDEARATCRKLLEDRALGEAGSTLVIEDFMPGAELTVLALTDGDDGLLLAPSQDHKRARDGDEGPNTGGMGAFAPVPWADEALLAEVRRRILNPTLAGLKQEGIAYRGVLYLGLMVAPDGGLALLEYNVRMGDPETQVVLPLFGGDFAAAVAACANGTLRSYRASPCARSALGVVAASRGYPDACPTGLPIEGLDAALGDAVVYHAGTGTDGQGNVVTAGGRVLTVVGTGNDLEEAREAAYRALKKIRFEGMHFRTDIGKGAKNHDRHA